jgi:cytochrome c-type biogenesis protein
MALDAVLTSISLGLLATTSPCVLPLYPGYLAYLASSGGGQDHLAEHSYGRYLLGIFVLAGVLVMMLTLGLVIALLSLSVGQALVVIIPLADFLIVGLGLLLLLDRNPFKRLPQLQAPVLSHPYVNAFIYGLLYGPIALPCSGPLVVGIFALSLTAGQALGQLAVFLWFGVGFGLPLLILSFLSGAAQRWITRQFAIHARLINISGGLLLIGIGLYDFWVNWETLTLFL